MHRIQRFGVLGGLSMLVGVVASAAGQDPAPQPAAPGAIVRLEIVVVELSSAVENAADLESDLGDDPIAGVLELQKQGKAQSVTRFQLTTVEDKSATLSIGEQAPIVTGRSATSGRGGGPFANSYAMQNVGSQLQISAKVESGGSVLVRLELEKSSIAKPVAGGEKEADEFTPPSVVRGSLKTEVRVPAGKTVLVSGSQSTSGDNAARSIVLIGAKVSPAPEADAKNARASADELRVFALQYMPAAECAGLLARLGLGTAQFVADERTNSILAKGAPDDLEIAKALLVKLDLPKVE